VGGVLLAMTLERRQLNSTRALAAAQHAEWETSGGGGVFPGRAQETETRTRRANQYLVALLSLSLSFTRWPKCACDCTGRRCLRLASPRATHIFWGWRWRPTPPAARLLLQILTQAPIDTTRGCLKVLEKRVAQLVFPV
jgi:hypothetical protein